MGEDRSAAAVEHLEEADLEEEECRTPEEGEEPNLHLFFLHLANGN